MRRDRGTLVAQRRPHDDAPAQLVRAETRATGRLAAGAAYEIEGPLARVRASLQSAVASPVACAQRELHAALEEALRAAEQIEETARGLRAFASGDEAPPGGEAADVHEAIELGAHFARAEIDARATLRRSYRPAPRARASLPVLARVILALLRNAAQSIPAGAPWANSILITTGAAGAHAIAIEIADTGAGIEPEDLPFVFDPFFTTKPTETSPGLGLAAAHAAVLDLGGTIEVASTVGRGSVFRVVLPAADEEPGALRLPEPEPRVRRLLCVSESAAERDRIRRLVDDGATRIVFATFAEALERLSLGEEYDLVLCEACAAVQRGFREELGRLAPRVVDRTFGLALQADMPGTA